MRAQINETIMNIGEITSKVQAIESSATEKQVSDVLVRMKRTTADIHDNHITAIAQEIRKMQSQLTTSGRGFTPAPKAKPIAEQSSAIAPITNQTTLKSKASGVVEEALIEQQTEAAKLAADSAASNAAFMQKVRDRAAELDREQEQADIDAAAKLVRQSRVSARTQTMDFLQQMVGQTTEKSIGNIRESVEVLEAELV